MASVKERKRTQPSAREHKQILEAIRRGDERAAEQAAYEHITNTMEKFQKIWIWKRF